MKQFLFALLIATFLSTSCSDDSVTFNDSKSVQTLDSKTSTKKESPYRCNKFTVTTMTVGIGVISVDITLDKPINIYVCCGPAFVGYGGCAPVNKLLYDALNGTKSVDDPINVGIPISEIIGDPAINLKDVTTIDVKESLYTDGQRIALKTYPVDSNGLVYFELEKQ